MPLTSPAPWRARAVRWNVEPNALAAMFLAAVGVLFASFELPSLLGARRWLISTDMWPTVESARWISTGAIGTVYQANPWRSALPGFPALLAPFVFVGDHLGLTQGAPFPVARPTLWLLLGPVCAVVGSLSVLGVGRLARAAGIGLARRRTLVFCYAAVVVVPTVIVGHPEDLVALGLTCWAFALALEGRRVSAALPLCAAILMQTWAGLALPLLVVMCPRSEWRPVLVRAAALPAAVAAMLLALDPRHAAADLLGQPMAGRGQHLPAWSVARGMTVSDGYRSYHVISGSSTRFLAVAGAVALAVLVRRTTLSKGQALLCLATVFFLRDLFEVEVWPYYLAPAAVLLLLAGSASGRPRRAWAVGGVSLLLYGSSCMAYAGTALPVAAWSAVTFVPAGAALVCLLVASRRSTAAKVSIGTTDAPTSRDFDAATAVLSGSSCRFGSR